MWNSFNFVFCIIKHTIGDQPGVVDIHTEYDASIVKKYMSELSLATRGSVLPSHSVNPSVSFFRLKKPRHPSYYSKFSENSWQRIG